MSNSTPSNGHKRPKLSLSIKPSNGPRPRQSTSYAKVDPQSPTAFNTLTNVYTTAIERSTPATAIDTSQQPLHVDTTTESHRRLQTPYGFNYPETPPTADPDSPTAMDFTFPCTMTATPPLSAGPTDPNEAQKFTLLDAEEARDISKTTLDTQPETKRQSRKATLSNSSRKPPYAHSRSLHSILRNSPLPHATARTPISQRCQSLRLQEKAARRVAYNSPIEQTITTNKYTKSHIDLLFEDASPHSPASGALEPDTVLDLAVAFTEDETRDGGQTPGPFEEMRRRMAGLAGATPLSPSGTSGIRKRKRREKKRRWVWTIGKEGEEEDEDVGGAIAALRAAEARPSPERPQVQGVSGVQMGQAPRGRVQELPTPSVEDSSEEASGGVDMSDDGTASSVITDERASTPGDVDIDMMTPTTSTKGDGEEVAAFSLGSNLGSERLGPAHLFNPETGTRRDTPVPPNLVAV